jgi:hypothetical protein
MKKLIQYKTIVEKYAWLAFSLSDNKEQRVLCGGYDDSYSVSAYMCVWSTVVAYPHEWERGDGDGDWWHCRVGSERDGDGHVIMSLTDRDWQPVALAPNR